MNILITGGTGFIGRSIVQKILTSGHSVTVLDNDSRGNITKLNHLKKDFKYITGDVRNLDVVIKATKNIDKVIHLAYINGTEFFYTRPFDVLEVALKGMLNILDAHRINRFSELIIASTSETYQNASVIPTPEKIPLVVPDVLNSRFSYGGGKIATELLAINYAKQHNLKIKIFRPHNIYGPDMGNEHAIPQIIRNVLKGINIEYGNSSIVIQGTGRETRSFCYIEDFLSGFDAIMADNIDMNIYNIGVNDEISILDLVSTIGDLLKINVVVQKSEILNGSPLRRCPDISKITNLGFKQRWDLRAGLQETIKWYSQN